jgi:hypothetical protein
VTTYTACVLSASDESTRRIVGEAADAPGILEDMRFGDRANVF